METTVKKNVLFSVMMVMAVVAISHGGSRFSQSVQTIKELEKEAQVIEGPSVSARNVSSAEPNVIAWLEKHGFKK